MSYGIQPTGYVRKPISVILAELEAEMVTEFGPGVIQTPQTPLGQLNGLMADMVAELWERAEDLYQSYDPDQAEGTRLDTLGRIRLLNRGGGEGDTAYRQAITNVSRSRVDVQDLVRAVRGLEGVTYVQVFTDQPDVDPGYVAVAVLGGDDAEIAETLRRYVVPGISTYGNHAVTSVIEGFCRSMSVIRPVLVPVELAVTVKLTKDSTGCPPPSTTAIRAALAENLDVINGRDVTTHLITATLNRLFSNVEVTRAVSGRDGNPAIQTTTEIGFTEMATFNFDNISVVTA